MSSHAFSRAVTGGTGNWGWVSARAVTGGTGVNGLKDLQFIELLPDAAVQNNFVWQWAVLVSRVVTKYLPPFKAFRKNVIFHIPHKYSKEMATKSETVSAGLHKCLIKP